jgi:hypothetical protein
MTDLNDKTPGERVYDLLASRAIYMSDKFIDELLAAAAPASLTPAPQGTASAWKLTADEMPPVDTLVLCCGVKRVGMAVMEYNERDRWQIARASEWHSSYPPSHWRPLPAEPANGEPTK